MKSSLLFFVFLLIFFILFHSVSLAESMAYIGPKFGVGKIILPTDEIHRFFIAKGNDSILYPVLTYEYGQDQIPWKKGNKDRKPQATIYFLFQNKTAFSVTIQDNKDLSGESQYFYENLLVNPIQDDVMYETMLQDWWHHYSINIKKLIEDDLYPSTSEVFLLHTLSRRLNLPLPDIYHPYWTREHELEEMVGLFTGAESIKSSLQRGVILQDTLTHEIADQPLPKEVLPPAVVTPLIPATPMLESIAFHVPAECWYIRCGSFANFKWMRKTADDWGGNLRDMVSIRGIDYDVKTKIETQLSIQETELGKILGGMIIKDVAILGTDMFLREGGTFGIIFESKNNPLLTSQLNKQRLESLTKFPQAKLETIAINNTPVSFLHTSDNQIRSFYVIDGNYHLVTNSQYIVKRFLECWPNRTALAHLEEFHYARTLHPVSNNDNLFIYLSDPFFRMIVGPHYRVEMTRRMKAEVAIVNAQLALLMAKAENANIKSINDLCEQGYLPKNFNQRVETGSIAIQDGVVLDTLRGRATLLTPIMDMEISKITRSEAEGYQKFAELYRREWQRMDPVIITIKQNSQNSDKEKISMDIHIFPYAQNKYGNLAECLNTPDTMRFDIDPTACFTFQTQISQALLDWVARGEKLPNCHVAVSLYDMGIPLTWYNGMPYPARQDESDLQGYAILPTQLFDFINRRNSVKIQNDADGIECISDYETMFLKRVNEYTLLSWNKPTLIRAYPKIKIANDARPAQVRFHINSLSNTKIRKYFDALIYTSSRRVTCGNLYLMDSLTNQFGIPAEEIPQTTQLILHGRLVSPLGCSYELKELNPKEPAKNNNHLKIEYPKIWTVNSELDIQKENYVPQGYQSAFLDWFQGLNLDFSIDGQTLCTHLEVEVQPTK